MIFRFNEAQLGRLLRERLRETLDVLQAENKVEIEVMAIEFPSKLMVKLDDDAELVLVWDADKSSYSGITLPEPSPEPEPELTSDLEGVRTLARDFFDNVKAMNCEQRQVFWSEISSIIAKEIL